MEIPVGVGAFSEPVKVVDIPRELDNRLDLLFVVDNTEDMDQRQRELAEAFAELYQHLALAEQGLPDLHIGVVSTDLGADIYASAIESCDERGDDGRLLMPTDGECGMIDGVFLRQMPDLDGDVVQNFSGHIADMFACMSQIGSSGCEYEQPLEAMRRALDGFHAPDAEFSRPGSVLGVVVLSNEDDCTTIDPSLMDPANMEFTHNSANYRCFEKGVICAGDDVFQPGRQQGCAPNASSKYVADVNEYANFLQQQKPADRLVVGAMIGDSSLVETHVTLDGIPQLVASCDGSDGGAAYPAIRLQAFVDGFGQGGDVMSLCGKERRPFESLLPTAQDIRRALGTKCLAGQVADIDDFSDGIQPHCTVYRIEDGNQNVANDGVEVPIPECGDTMNPGSSPILPCYTIRQDPACRTFTTSMALTVYDENGRPSGGGSRAIGLEQQRVFAECLTAAALD